jgi:hypothetical protein
VQRRAVPGTGRRIVGGGRGGAGDTAEVSSFHILMDLSASQVMRRVPVTSKVEAKMPCGGTGHTLSRPRHSKEGRHHHTGGARAREQRGLDRAGMYTAAG